MVEAGRADAMAELAGRLIECRRFVDRSDESLRREAIRRFGMRNRRTPTSDADLDQIATAIEADSRRVEHCRDIDPVLMDTRVSLLERAARAGDIGAMIDYAGMGLHDLRSPDDLRVHFDEVARRRQLAGDLLRGALARGACEALPILSDAYAGGRGQHNWLFTPDPFQRLVYAEAASQANLGQQALDRARANVVDPDRQRAAAAQGATIAKRHCASAG